MTSNEAIERSPEFRKWCAAFRESAGIDVHLVGAHSLENQLSHATGASPLCRFLHTRCTRCNRCRRRFAKRLASAGVNHSGTFAMRCFAGLTVSAIPLKLGDGSTAFLFTGPAFLGERRKINPANEIARRVECHADRHLSPARIKQLARDVPLIKRSKFHAAVILLHLLAEHLSHVSRQMLAMPTNGGSDEIAVRRACKLIDQRFTENLRLGDVARTIGVSPSYLSHLFGKHMGHPFTHYLSGRRVIEMKRLLTDSGLTITEAMFAAGFQSISQANRVFRASTGMAPRQFRSTIRG